MEKRLEAVKRKIRGLFRLAGDNPNENEAKTALLKAQELMGKYLLEESELGLNIKEEVVFLEYGEFARRDFRRGQIVHVVAEAFGCFFFYRGGKGRQKFIVAGKKNKAEMVIEIARSADKTAFRLASAFERQLQSSFIYGFAEGLRLAFEKQSENQEWGLVLQKDAETIEAHSAMKFGAAAKSRVEIYGGAYRDGESEGFGFGRNYNNPKTESKKEQLA